MMSALGLGRNRREHRQCLRFPRADDGKRVHKVCIAKEAHPVENKQGSGEVKQGSERISPVWFHVKQRPQAHLQGTRDVQLESRHHTAALCPQVLPERG